MSKKQLDFKKPIQTRAGSTVRIYEIFTGYIIGAVYEDCEDVWYPYSWDISGMYADKPSSLDLVNCK